MVVSLFSPEGKKLAEVDSPNGAVGPERLSVVLERQGTYRLEVRSREKNASGCEIRLGEWRLASKTDLTRHRLFADAEQLRKSATLESRRAAIVRHQEAQRQFALLADVAGESDSSSGLARVLYSLGDNQPALEAYRHALEGKRTVGDRQAEAYLLQNMGAVYSHLSEYAKALDYFPPSLEMNTALRNRKSESVSSNMMGAVYEMQGEMQMSLDYYNRPLALNRADGDRQGQAIVLNNIGNTYSLLGETALALDYFQQALLLMRAVDDKWWESSISAKPGSRWATGRKRWITSLKPWIRASVWATVAARLDFEASREAIAGRNVAEAGIVHVATHGLLNTVHPELSGLVLSLVVSNPPATTISRSFCHKNIITGSWYE